jgi:polyhydroxybutyrate depolymerase
VKSIPAILLTSLFLLTAAPLPSAFAFCDSAPSPDRAASTGPLAIEVGGLRRAFIVRTSSGIDPGAPAPVVFVFHPFGMSAQYMESRVSTRLWPGAIMVYPEGASRPGAGYQPSWQGRAGELGDRDLLFFDALIAWLNEHHCIDERRLFAFGYSNGASFAGLLACERADRIAGLAIASGRLPCAPAVRKPVAITHGLKYSTAPYAEGVRLATTWAKQNGCKAPPRVGTPGCFEATGCAAATAVLMCTSPGGHEYSSAFTRPALEMFQKIRN